MDKAVERVEAIFGHLFAPHLALNRNRRWGGARPFGTAVTMKPALAAMTRPKSICRYAP